MPLSVNKQQIYVKCSSKTNNFLEGKEEDKNEVFDLWKKIFI